MCDSELLRARAIITIFLDNNSQVSQASRTPVKLCDACHQVPGAYNCDGCDNIICHDCMSTDHNKVNIQMLQCTYCNSVKAVNSIRCQTCDGKPLQCRVCRTYGFNL